MRRCFFNDGRIVNEEVFRARANALELARRDRPWKEAIVRQMRKPRRRERPSDPARAGSQCTDRGNDDVDARRLANCSQFEVDDTRAGAGPCPLASRDDPTRTCAFQRQCAGCSDATRNGGRLSPRPGFVIRVHRVFLALTFKRSARFRRTPRRRIAPATAVPPFPELKGERFGDELAAVIDAVERDEASHSRSLARSGQRFVKRLEPAAQALERVTLADLEYGVLDQFAIGVGETSPARNPGRSEPRPRALSALCAANSERPGRGHSSLQGQ